MAVPLQSFLPFLRWSLWVDDQAIPTGSEYRQGTPYLSLWPVRVETSLRACTDDRPTRRMPQLTYTQRHGYLLSAPELEKLSATSRPSIVAVFSQVTNRWTDCK